MDELDEIFGQQAANFLRLVVGVNTVAELRTKSERDIHEAATRSGYGSASALVGRVLNRSSSRGIRLAPDPRITPPRAS